MSINDTLQKIKLYSSSEKGRAVYVILIIILVAGSSFGLGRISKTSSNSDPVRVIYADSGLSASAIGTSSNKPPIQASVGGKGVSGAYVASKRGKKYYPVNCSAADSLKAENKIFFTSEAQAQTAGYTKSSSC